MNYWLFKSEPNTFGIAELEQKQNQTTCWEGVRNYQVRNMLRDQIKVNDQAFFYHSSCAQPGIAGIVKIVQAAYPDFTQFDPMSRYFDPKSSVTHPRWYMVDVQLVKKFPRIITLTELRAHPFLQDMWVLRKGNRLSITPVTEKEWCAITDFYSSLY